MKLLLDTVTFLDSALASSELSPRAKDLLLDPENERYVSIASVWEIAIKYSVGKLELRHAPGAFIEESREKLAAEMLTLDLESVLHVIRLPHVHRDPFDRILICQAMVHGMVLLTPDPVMSRYPVRTAW
jgi:PIN domain nuclease of toxin-antitoxin system